MHGSTDCAVGKESKTKTMHDEYKTSKDLECYQRKRKVKRIRLKGVHLALWEAKDDQKGNQIYLTKTP